MFCCDVNNLKVWGGGVSRGVTGHGGGLGGWVGGVKSINKNIVKL